MQARRRTRVLAALLVVATAGLTAGCELRFGDEAPPAPTVNLERAGRLLTQAETKAAIPGDGSTAPAGYAIAPKNLLKPGRGDDTVRPARCGALYGGVDIDFVESRVRSYTTFRNSDKTLLGVGVASKQRLVGLDAPKRNLGSCRKFEISSEGQTMRVTARPITFPEMGEQTVAFRFTARDHSLVTTYDAVRIQAGHNAIFVDQVSGVPRPRNPVEMVEVADTVLLNLSN